MWSHDDTPIVRTVYKGSLLQDDNGGEYQTLADFWSMIDEWCFQDCPNSGPHSCQIKYETSADGLVYPASIYIDYEELVTFDEAVFIIENVDAFECAELDIDSNALKPNKCPDYLAVKNSLETALRDWEDAGDCYNYTIEDQTGSPVHIAVRGDVAAIVGDTSQTELTRTISDWLAEIQEMAVDRCKFENDQDPYQSIYLEYDPIWGYPSSIDFALDDENFYFIISGFERCGGRKPGVCVDYERMKSDYFAAKMAWEFTAGIVDCYTYTVERKDSSSEALSGLFTVLVQDYIPKIVQAPPTYNEVDGPNMTNSLWDWIVHIKEHCVEGCESDSSILAYRNCTVKIGQNMGTDMTMFFDLDELRKVEYVVSSFSLCDSWSTFDVEKAKYATARTKLKTLLTENPCYEFTYTVLSDSAPSTKAVTVKVSRGVPSKATPTDQFSNLFDVMSFYETNCFPKSSPDSFPCSIAFDDMGVPILASVNYSVAVEEYASSVSIDNITFLSCDSSAPTSFTRVLKGVIAVVVGFLL